MARRRWTKILGLILLILILTVGLGITFTIGWRPIIGAKKRPLSDRKLEATPARLARGRYLVDGVNECFGCHTDADWSKPGAPPVEGREGSGHIWADQDMPWLVAPNITPDKETGAGNWTDDMLARAIREGIGHDGRTLHLPEKHPPDPQSVAPYGPHGVSKIQMQPQARTDSGCAATAVVCNPHRARRVS